MSGDRLPPGTPSSSVSARAESAEPQVGVGAHAAGSPVAPAPPVPLPHRVTGAGTPVVLLNGGMMSFAAWEPVAVHLRQHHTVLQLDFRGQLYALDRSPSDLAGHAADVLALLDHLGWRTAHLVGTSFGALVAVAVAGTAPARVRSLVLATAMDRETPSFRADRERTALAVAAARAEGLAAQADPAAPPSLAARERFWDDLTAGVYSERYLREQATALAARRAQLAALPAVWYTGVEQLLATLADFDLAPWLDAVTAPALVVHAAGDRVMEAGRAYELAAAIEAELVVHPTAGHALVAEDPDWLAEVCREFLARQEAPRS